jgi:hypothetical protein
MQYRAISLISLLMLAGAATAVAADGAPTNATWQSHTAKFHYYGFTTHYTCDGLEDKVKTILVHLGARTDAKVHATGCVNGPNAPSPFAWIDATFSTVAASSSATGADVVQAQWVDFQIAPRRPFDMGDGECELMDQMKDVITRNFALQDLSYRTSCTPHQISTADYGIKGRVLRPVAVKVAAAK